MLRIVSAVLLAAVVGGAAEQETKTLHLTGRGNDDPLPWEFFCTGGHNSGRWTTIGVPSNWELKGFGSYNYGQDRRKSDEQGKYKRAFTIPNDWQGKRIFLVFEGVMTDTEVWVNGQSAGPKHQGGFYRFKYEITNLVKLAENLLEVTVSKVSSNRSVEQAERQSDYWVFGGIYRPVYLEAVPKAFIEWVAIDARADGVFRMGVHVNGKQGADSVRAEIIGPDGSRLGAPFETEIAPGQSVTTVQTQVSEQKNWTAETPNLYQARVTLLRGQEPVHTITQRFGFRTFEVRPGDGLYLNGQKIRLKGVCRHSFWPDSGRCLSRKINYDDVRLIKKMNMNAVRMSHYPPDRDFLEACDELGLYVLDELAGWQRPPYDTEIGRKLVAEMVPRDVCHPCILFWDNGNEGGWNRDLDGEFARYDPQNRMVLHPWENFNGIDTDHYESYASTLSKLASGNLFMPTEFLHGLYDGGLGAGLDDYWRAMYDSPLGAGGFLWALVDEGVVRTDEGGRIDVRGNLAPDGIVGPYREKEASFYTIKEIWSPIQVPLERLPSDFDGKVPVENRYDFTNLNQCRFTLQSVTFPGPMQKRDGHDVLTEKTVVAPDVPPHGNGMLDLALPSEWHNADALYLTAYDPGGKEVWTWSWDIGGHDRLRRERANDDSPLRGTPARSVVQGGRVRVEAGDLVMVSDANTADVTTVSVAGKAIAFTGGPTLIGGTAGKAALAVRQEGEAVVLDADYAGDMKHMRWTVYPSGWVRLEYEFALEGRFDLFGVSFDYPEEKMRSMRWLGRGPYRVWKNRMKGGRLDVWNNICKSEAPGETWDFPEFRGYYRDWYWVTFTTEQGEITVVNDTNDLFLGVYTPNDGPFPANTKLDAPQTGIAFLHGIPPIGTKFQRPSALGPEGQKNKASGTYRGSVWFHFDNS